MEREGRERERVEWKRGLEERGEYTEGRGEWTGKRSGKDRGVEERREWKREGHRRERIVKKEGSGRKRESEERGDRKGRKE